MNIDWQRFWPKYWYQSPSTDWDWDKALNIALDQHSPKRVSAHSVQVGPFRVWDSNYPYSYGDRYEGGVKAAGLPSVATRKRLKAAIAKQLIIEAKGSQS